MNAPASSFEYCRKLKMSRMGLVITILFGIPLIVTLLLQAKLHQRLKDYSVSAIDIFGVEPPQNFDVVLTQRTAEGKFARIIDPALQVRLDIFVVEQGGSTSGAELLDSLKREKALKEKSSIDPAITKMFLGELNPLRAKFEKSIDISIGETVRTISRVLSKDKEIFYLGVIGTTKRQYGFILLDPEDTLNEGTLASTLSVLASVG